MSRHDSFINRAVGVALTSTCRWRHGSVIAKGSRLVAYSANVHRNSPEVTHAESSWHAEEAALRALHRATGATYGIGQFKGYTLYVARVNTKNEPKFSRPCVNCWKLIAGSGITGVYYTNELGGLSHETIM